MIPVHLNRIFFNGEPEACRRSATIAASHGATNMSATALDLSEAFDIVY